MNPKSLKRGMELRRASGAAACLVLASGLLAGCGGGQSDHEGVQSAFESVGEAVAARDARGVCAQLGPQARRQLATVGHGESPCTTGLRPMVEQLTRRADAQSVLGRTSLEGVEVRTTAVATVEVDGREIKVPFVKQGDRWKLDSFYGLDHAPSVAIP